MGISIKCTNTHTARHQIKQLSCSWLFFLSFRKKKIKGKHEIKTLNIFLSTCYCSGRGQKHSRHYRGKQPLCLSRPTVQSVSWSVKSLTASETEVEIWHPPALQRLPATCWIWKGVLLFFFFLFHGGGRATTAHLHRVKATVKRKKKKRKNLTWHIFLQTMPKDNWRQGGVR